MANSLRAGLEPACGAYFHWPHNGPMSTIPSPRVPEVNYSPVWMSSAGDTYHIETHYPHEYPAYLQIRLTVVAVNAVCFYMVGAQGLEPRTYRLKADCSSQLSYTPILVPRPGFEPGPC